MEIIRPVFSPSQDVPNQSIYNLPKRLGNGIIRVNNFSSGLILYYMNLRPTRPISLVSENTSWNYGIGFNVTGHSEVRLSTHRLPLFAKSGLSMDFIYPKLLHVEEDIGMTRKVKICILFDTKTLLDLANEDEEPFFPFLEGFQKQIPVIGQDKTEPEMKLALNQLVACPYIGKTRTLFLESKGMELLARRLEQIKIKDKSSPRQPRINKIDIERIHYAAELLMCDPANPPDLTTLAGKIGMSRSKFYQNFKMVFGHSPLNHLRSHRLRVARQLLKQGRHNVSEAAFAVGYSNHSYFARIFFAEFGVHPHHEVMHEIRNKPPKYKAVNNQSLNLYDSFGESYA